MNERNEQSGEAGKGLKKRTAFGDNRFIVEKGKI